MKAVIFDKKSTSEKLTCCDVEKPAPADNELLVQVHSSSVNAADYRMLQMGFPPKKKIFGADVAGIVEAVGNNVKDFKPGDSVIGELSDAGFGGFAEHVCASEKAFVHKPEELSFEYAASLPLAATTALQALRNSGKAVKDSQVLIIGSSGGVGSYAVEGKIKPVIDKSYSLGETAEAFRYIREKHVKGKVIIKIINEQ